MYNPITTEDFDKWITAESRTFEVKCEVIDGADTVVMSGTGQSGDIISMEWSNVICSNDGLQIGTTCMDEFKMTYRNKDGLPSLMNKEIHPYVGLVCPHENTGDVTVWIPLGIFYVTNTETADEDKTFTLTAYDGMQMFMGGFDATALGVTFPINAWTLLTAITTHFGTTVSYDKLLFDLLSSDDYIITVSGGDKLVVQQDINANQQAPLDKPLEGTYRDYIGWIVGLVGANAHMGRSGELWVGRYEDHGYQIPRTMQHMGGAKINYGGSVTYTSIVSGTDENPLYPTNHSGNAITYTNPYITQEELDILNDAVFEDSNITVTPCDVTWRSDPRIDAGDIVSVEDKDGNFSPTYVMERVMRITGGIAEELHCYAETEVVHTLNKSPLVTKFAQLTKDIKEAVNPIDATKGTFEFINNGDGTNGGFTIYENGTNSWLRCTAGGLGISADGGLTYANAITKDGVVASKLTVVGNGYYVYRAYYDAKQKRSYMTMLNPANGMGIVQLTGGRNITTNPNYYGNVGTLSIYDGRGHTGVSLTASSYDDPSVTPRSYFAMYVPGVYGSPMIQMETYRTQQNTLTSHLEICDPNDDSLPAFTIRQTNGDAYIAMKTASKGYHSATWQEITINGIRYFLLGSTS